MTAASSTAGCAISAPSSSMDDTHSPPDLMTSFVRSVSWRYPYSSITPTSPVRSHPSSKRSSEPGALKYADATQFPLICTSPIDLPSHGHSSPVAMSTIRTRIPGIGRPAFARVRNRSSSGSSSNAGIRCESVPTGPVSVIPQPCTSFSPYFFSNVSATGFWPAVSRTRAASASVSCRYSTTSVDFMRSLPVTLPSSSWSRL